VTALLALAVLLQAAPPPPAAVDAVLAADLLAMLQRLDDRFTGAETTISTLSEQAERLEQRSLAQGEELAAQRAALARIERAVGHPPARLASARPGATRVPPPPRES